MTSEKKSVGAMDGGGKEKEQRAGSMMCDERNIKEMK